MTAVSIPSPDEKLIHNAYRKLLRTIKNPIDATDRKLIREAYEMAVAAHHGQTRKSGEPYILHPLAVATICTEEIGLGPTAVAAALLHDVVEDTPVTQEEIGKKFGAHIARMVDGLTKLDGAYNAESPQAENFRKVLGTLVEDVRVVLIKMADRLHNMRTLGAMSRQKQLKVAAETSYLYAPLAHRLGLYAMKTEFLDLCMKITEPESYHDIARKLADTKRERNRYINEFIRPLTPHLDALGYPYKIYGRPKSIYSIWNKIQTKHVPFEEIYDLFAVRVVLDVLPNQEKLACWAVYSTITDVYRAMTQRLKDWVTTPKSNGYESLHATVIGPQGKFVEVQIRSTRMDDIAERGFAAHWKYKGVSNQPDVFEQWLDSVREIMEDPESNAVEFLDNFKDNNLFQEEVFVYTPKGELKMLPVGATALDFAFSIHTDVGYHCTAVKVNNKLVPMGYKMQNGDQVKIITNKSQKPSEDWLKIVVTGKARAKIKSAMKEERRKMGEYGREALQRKLRNLKLELNDEIAEKLARHFDFNSHVDLYYALFTGELTVEKIFKEFHVEGNTLQENPTKTEESKPGEPGPGKPSERKKDLSKARLVINGEPAERYSYSLATCCNPVQGDDIFAYVTANATLKIHRTTCPNAAHLLANYGYRIMKAEWIHTPGTTFVADLKITGIDNGPGVIERLTHAISSTLNLNIRTFTIAGDQGYFEGRVSLVVQNTDQLNIAIRSLLKLPNVSTVERVV